MSYWDIDQFLAEEEVAQFCFKKDAHGFQFLSENQAAEQTVCAGQPLHAPLWILSTLYNYIIQQQEQLVNVKMPEYLHTDSLVKFIQPLLHKSSRVSAEVANLREKSPYFYQNYAKFIKLGKEDEAKLTKECIKEILECRGHCILGRAETHFQHSRPQRHLSKYTEMEFRIYQEVKNKICEYNEWRYNTVYRR